MSFMESVGKMASLNNDRKHAVEKCLQTMGLIMSVNLGTLALKLGWLCVEFALWRWCLLMYFCWRETSSFSILSSRRMHSLTS